MALCVLHHKDWNQMHYSVRTYLICLASVKWELKRKFPGHTWLCTMGVCLTHLAATSTAYLQHRPRWRRYLRRKIPGTIRAVSEHPLSTSFSLCVITDRLKLTTWYIIGYSKKNPYKKSLVALVACVYPFSRTYLSGSGSKETIETTAYCNGMGVGNGV